MDPGERTDLASDPSASRARLTVFIVDSDVDVRQHLTAIVRAAGWHGLSFGSAEELLADPRSLAPGCILLDVDLPGLSGLDLQHLLAERAGISVIFVSACRDVRLTVRAGRHPAECTPARASAGLQAVPLPSQSSARANLPPERSRSSAAGPPHPSPR